MPGPVPKRTDARHGHRTKAENNVSQADSGGPVKWRPAPQEWHKIARDWYKSLRNSGQARFYEQSDAAAAFYVAEAMSRNLKEGKFSSMLFTAVTNAMGDLLTTEGDRRRARIELQRETSEDTEAPKLAVMDEYREMAS